MEGEGYYISPRKWCLNPWAEASSTRIYLLAVDGRRAPRTALSTALKLADALHEGRCERPPHANQHAFLVPDTALWQQHVQPLLESNNRQRVPESVGGGASQHVISVLWAAEAAALRRRWHAQGFEHYAERPWTQAGSQLLCGVPRRERSLELLDLGFLWASHSLGLQPFSERDRPVISRNLFIDLSQNQIEGRGASDCRA